MKNEEINIVSCFDGMSCLQLALQRTGIHYDKYFASEIDKPAMKVTQANFPNTIQLGSITDIDPETLPNVYLLAGGSPCQGFSFAGKGLNFKDPRSKLFFEFIRIKNALQAKGKLKYFLLENVRMAKEHEKIITEMMGVLPITINSSLVSAQNRERLYWTNIGEVQAGLFGDTYPGIQQPKDKGIVLKDILETEVDPKYYLSEKMINYLYSRKANYNGGKINYKTGEDQASCINASSGAIDISENIIVDVNKKASCLSVGGHSGGLNSQMDVIKCVAMRGRGEGWQQQLEIREDDKTNSLTSATKDNLVIQPTKYKGKKKKNITQINPSKESGETQPYQQNRVYDANGIVPALLADMSSGTHAIFLSEPQHKHGEDRYYTEKAPTMQARYGTGGDNIPYVNNVRRLTPIECERLQTVPDNYTNHVSNSQRYKMLGNGWTIDVITHILSYIK